MIKVLSLMKRKDGLSFEAFRRWALDEHPRFGLDMPGLRHYRMNVAIEDNPEAAYDCVSELWFDDVESFKAALNSEAGQAAGKDIAEHAAPNRIRLITEEHVIIE